MASKYFTAYEGLARTLSSKAGVKVICKGDGFCTNGSVVVIPEIPDELNKQLRDPALAGLLHETQHIRHSCFKPSKNKRLMAARGLWNNLEDVRMYELGKKDYQGYQNLQEAGLAYLTEYLITPKPGMPQQKTDPFTNLGGAIQWEASGVDSSCFPEGIREIAKIVKPEVDKMKWLPGVKGQKQSEELTLKILDILGAPEATEQQKNKSKKPEEEEEGTDNEEGDKNEGGSGDTEESQEENIENDEDPCESDNDGDNGDEENDDDGGDGEGESSPATSGESEDELEKELENLNQEMEDNLQEMEDEGVEEGDLQEGNFMQKLQELISLVIRSSNTDNNIHVPHPEIIPYDVEQTIQEFDPGAAKNSKQLAKDFAEITGSIDKQSKLLKAKILPVLMAEKRCSYLVDQEEGIIDSSRLYRVPSGQRKIYKRKVQGRKVDTAVSILCDVSGSMQSRPIEMLKRTLAVNADTLMALKIPFEILAFTTCGRGSLTTNTSNKNHKAVRERNNLMEVLSNKRFRDAESTKQYNRFVCTNHIIIKSFKENYLNTRKFIPLINSCESNIDGEAVKWAGKRLAMQRQKRKILMVLSDGNPACYMSDTELLNKDLTTQVKKMEQSGIEVIGIGILTDEPAQFYPQFTRIDTLEDVASKTYKALLQTLKN